MGNRNGGATEKEMDRQVIEEGNGKKRGGGRGNRRKETERKSRREKSIYRVYVIRGDGMAVGVVSCLY